MTPRAVQLLVLAKAPRAGRVKTRLCPTVHPTDAARLAAAALADTLAAAAEARVRRRVLVLAGNPGSLPEVVRNGLAGVDLRRQVGRGLGPRIDHAMVAAWRELPVPVLLIGMDTPQITAADLDAAAAALSQPGTDAVVGPAEDGGFWLLGMRAPRGGLVDGVPMSRSDTGAALLTQLAGQGLRCDVLAVHRDVDVVTDAAYVAARAPDSRFAAVWRDLQERAA